MISFDSPIAAVLGGNTRGTKFAEVKKLRTVGDLLDLFPRRYLPTGSLTRLDELREGDLITAVGEIVKVDVHSYTDRRTSRPAYRVEAQLRTERPAVDDVLRQAQAHRRVAGPPLSEGARGSSSARSASSATRPS